MGFYYSYVNKNWIDKAVRESLGEQWSENKDHYSISPSYHRTFREAGYTLRANERGSSDYSGESLSCVDYNRESPEDLPYRPRSSSPATSEKEYSIPAPSPLSHNELSRLPVVVVEKCDLKNKECSCGKAWIQGESVTQLYCSHRLHSTCANQLLEKGVCPTCNSNKILDPKHREIKIDLSGFNF